MSQFEIRDLHKAFENEEVLKGVSLNVERGEIVSFIGPSGGGKSTLLRCVNLLERYDTGQILYDGQNILGKGFDLERYRAEVCMIFQNFNLFDHLSVLENLNIAQVHVLGRSRQEASEKSMLMLEKVGLQDYYRADTRRLSGGQKQRVAIARALCMDPKALLLDEPTSALDPMMVDEVLNVIRDLSNEGLTLMIVTHEMRFAREISQRIAFLYQGRLLEIGSPEQIFDPQTEQLRAFLSNYI